MDRYNSLAMDGLQWLVLVAGAVALAARRRRAPRATGVALLVVGLMALPGAFSPFMLIARPGRPPQWVVPAVALAQAVTPTLFIAGLTVAAMMDRRRENAGA